MCLSDQQKRKAKGYKLMTVLGKNFNTNYILLNKKMVEAMQLIITQQEHFNIQSQNRFIFATCNTREGFICHWQGGHHNIPMVDFSVMTRESGHTARQIFKTITSSVFRIRIRDPYSADLGIQIRDPYLECGSWIRIQ